MAFKSILFVLFIWFSQSILKSQVREFEKDTLMFKSICIDSNAINELPFVNFEKNYFQFPSEYNPNWDFFTNNWTDDLLMDENSPTTLEVPISADIYTHTL